MGNFLKHLYENFWVPVFGRILRVFSSWIEGESILGRQTYDLRSKNEKDAKKR